MIQVKGLYKSFGNQHVLRGVDMQIQAGEAAIIIGRSGGGKSVLLKHLTGLICPDKGEIKINGIDIVGMQERELLIIVQILKFKKC